MAINFSNTDCNIVTHVWFLCSCRMTWLKKKIQQLGLHRRGNLISYTSVIELKDAIQVKCCFIYSIQLYEE